MVGEIFEAVSLRPAVMVVNTAGIAAVAVFYLVILFVGMLAAWKQRKAGRGTSNPEENIMLAKRDLGLFVGVLTMTATWVGGGYVNGSAEAVFSNGIVWCQTPFGYSLALILGGLFFAKPMREKGYVTMLDPFQIKYGLNIGGILFLPALFGETIWTASILSALGSTLSVILDMDNNLAVLSSAAVAVIYTFFGGMYSVALTDVIQLFFILFGLVLCIPFAWMHPAVNQEGLVNQDWLGYVEPSSSGIFVDNYLLLIFGGIPYQAYFQRVLSAKTSRQAQWLSYIAALLCTLLSIPSILLGGIAKNTDWLNGTEYGASLTSPDQIKQVLPLVLNYLTPQWVSFFGLGAVSAAVMSSADSCILSASSMFTHNIYKAIVFPSASGSHLMIVLRVSILAVAAIASLLAISINSIYGLSLLCSDMVYVLLFPQLLLVIHAESRCNKYGCVTSFMIGLVLRILSGEELLGLPTVIQFPFFSNGQQQIPFRTIIMVLTLVLHLGVSFITEQCFTKGWLPPKFDFLHCYHSPLEMTYQPEETSPEELHFQFMTNGKLESVTPLPEAELPGLEANLDSMLDMWNPKSNLPSIPVRTSVSDLSAESEKKNNEQMFKHC
ncbi:high-affinity choline transporter 1-like [Daphnia pulex]|uniref:high-affinity choline transporter 1-like n=1 Tax=Daphnia pulex TaxID=6669 RepID=UPI001EDCC213|nr:high-affinity choline transporter 1-like [Daphnia pulex]